MVAPFGRFAFQLVSSLVGGQAAYHLRYLLRTVYLDMSCWLPFFAQVALQYLLAET
jgi:hypothetical protein